MKVIKHNFSWEDNNSQETFWKYQKNLHEQAKDEVEKIIQLCFLNPTNHSVLDVGCGIGYHVLEFGLRGFNITGIEVADYSVNQAIRNTENIKQCSILKMLGEEIPWKSRFDLIIALRHTLGFMSFEKLRLHISKIWEAVKPGGFFILSIPFTLERGREKLPVHKWEEKDGKYILVNKSINDQNIKIEHCVLIDYVNDLIEEFNEEQKYYSWEEILGLLKACGISNITTFSDFDGNIAQDGSQARVFFMKKD